MTAFNDVFFHCFARKSKICHRIDPNPLKELTIKKNFTFSASKFTKIRHFEITKQKVCPLSDFSPGWEECSRWGGEHPLPNWEGKSLANPTPFGASSPNFELALTPLHVGPKCLIKQESLQPRFKRVSESGMSCDDVRQVVDYD